MQSPGPDFKKLISFREKKSLELKRMLSFSEALALWLSEALAGSGTSQDQQAALN